MTRDEVDAILSDFLKRTERNTGGTEYATGYFLSFIAGYLSGRHIGLDRETLLNMFRDWQ